MNNIAISVKNIGKQYRLGSGRKYDTLRDAMMGVFSGEGKSSGNNTQTIWALKDISFEISPGEVVGIIGRNGAGKSTLLKILSRITEPSTGQARIHGRVGSLLEVGTGFHPELSGRENVYLNGAILGMRRTEIDRRFDEIVAFAEIEKFLDTPVKRYSSGMYVRLAFAVAAHLDPEILLVDEVLAVGDLAFQKKCLGKMEDVSQQGRTVLFVSHNMAAIQALCKRGILLAQGQVVCDAAIDQTVNAYLKALEQNAVYDLAERSERRGRGNVRLTHVHISADERVPLSALTTGRPARFAFSVSESCAGLACTFTIYNQYGQPVANMNSAVSGPQDRYAAMMEPQFVCEIEELLLVPGRYRINAALSRNGELEDHVEGAAFFDVEQGQVHGRPVAAGSGYGSVVFPCRWVLPGGS